MTTSSVEQSELETAEADMDVGPKMTRRFSFAGMAKLPWAVAAVAAIVAVVGVCFGLTQRADFKDAQTATASREAAEHVALDYAVGAADMDFKDLASWRERLTKGASDDLAGRLTQASNSMEQIVVPLQWTSTAEPIAAKVDHVEGDTYFVDCFVNVNTKNAQAPEGIYSTATYRLAMDGSDDWRITEISGIGAGIGAEQTPPR